MSLSDSSTPRIGIFGPGSGALTITQALQQAIPDYSLVHLSDTKRAPYGNRNGVDIAKLLAAGITVLQTYNPTLLVIGCNTSSLFMQEAQSILKRGGLQLPPLLGVINPTVEFIATQGWHSIGILATPATVASNVFRDAIIERTGTASIAQGSIPPLPGLIDNGADRAVCREAIAEHFIPWIKQHSHIQGLALCCTHYPLLEEVFEEFAQETLGRHLPIITQGHCCSVAARQILGAPLGSPTRTEIQFLETGNSPSIRGRINRMFNTETSPATGWRDPLDMV